MKLRTALQQSGWDSFENSQHESWNVTDLLNTILPGESPNWLDAECDVHEDSIIDNGNDILTEVK